MKEKATRLSLVSKSEKQKPKTTYCNKRRFTTDIPFDEFLNCMYRFLLDAKLIQTEDEFLQYVFVNQLKINAFIKEIGVVTKSKGGVQA